MLSRKLDHARQRLDQLWRVAATLNPDAVLQRGYARVERRSDGATLSSAAEARKAGALTVRFADGAVDVVTDGGKVEAKPKPVKPPVTPGQAELF
jgi:exodeoxyribonuclease VII large subunit